MLKNSLQLHNVILMIFFSILFWAGCSQKVSSTKNNESVKSVVNSSTDIAFDIKISRQFGTQRLDFVLSGCRAFLLKPISPASDGSRPWLFVAPTFMGPHPTDPNINPYNVIHPIDVDTPVSPADRPDRATNAPIFTALLEKGFYIAGIEVGESYGNPYGRERFSDLYKFLVENYQLDSQVCLFAQSRGGLMLYNWAAEHPQWIRCIGANQPVCDIATWPGIEGAARWYGMTPEKLKAELAQHNPIDKLAPLAEHNIPILHIHGGNDNLINIEPHTMELARRYRALGGPIEVVVIPGVGHGNWPELLENPRLLEFYLQHTLKI